MADYRKLRTKSGLTLDEVAERAGVSKQHLSQIELGRKKPADALKVQLEEILVPSTKGQRFITMACSRCKKTADVRFDQCKTCKKVLCNPCLGDGCCGSRHNGIQDLGPTELRLIDHTTGQVDLSRRIERIDPQKLMPMLEAYGDKALLARITRELEDSRRVAVYVNSEAVITVDGRNLVEIVVDPKPLPDLSGEE